jgi:hypothetical protein
MSNYKPPVAKGSYGTNGQVKIVSVENGKVKFMFREQDKDGNFGETQKLIIKEEDCHPVAKVGTWACNLSTNQDRIYNLRPISGVIPAKFKEFRSRKDEAPTPQMTGGKFPHLVFRPVFELLQKDVEGMLVEYQWGLSYNFQEFPNEEDGKPSIVGYSKDITKSEPTQALNEFMEVCGIWERGPMAWQDNLLPKIQKRALDAAKTFMIHVEKGYVKVLIADQSSAFEDNSEDDGVE